MLGFFTRFTVSLENNYIFPTKIIGNYKKNFGIWSAYVGFEALKVLIQRQWFRKLVENFPLFSV